MKTAGSELILFFNNRKALKQEIVEPLNLYYEA